MPTENPTFSYAITHAHSHASDGMVSPQEVIKSAHSHKIGLIALTDHDTMDGTMEAREAAQRLEIETIVGIEVTTFNPDHLGGPLNQKHLIGLFPYHPSAPIHVIPDSKPVSWVIENIHNQGGLVIIPHPEGTTASFGVEEIRRLAEKSKIDGIEVINGIHNKRAELQGIIDDYNLAEIGASDSHFGHKDIGSSFTKFPGSSVNDFFEAIKNGKTEAVAGKHPEISRKDIIMQHGRAWIILGGRRYLLRNLRRLKTIPPEA